MMQAPLREIRCEGPFKRNGLGGWCGQLLLKVAVDTTGTWEMKCPRCRKVRTIRIDQPAMVRE